MLSFQWDNLLLECGLLAVLLPRDREAPWVHALLRVLLFKLYFESGIAKWQSHLGDWHDGSAMTFYYETAPIPTPLAWYAHHLPVWWHHLESRGTLVLELLLPLAIFGPRRARLAALVILSGFQLLNVATANYGFFCHLTVALHVFLLDENDVARAGAWLRRRIPGLARLRAGPAGPLASASEAAATHRPSAARRRRAGAIVACVLFLGISLVDALRSFAPLPWLRRASDPLVAVYRPLRLVNTYHLFGHITRERIEPEFQTRQGETWSAHAGAPAPLCGPASAARRLPPLVLRPGAPPAAAPLRAVAAAAPVSRPGRRASALR